MKQAITTNLRVFSRTMLLEAIDGYADTVSIKQQLIEKGIPGRKLKNKSKLDLVELLERHYDGKENTD